MWKSGSSIFTFELELCYYIQKYKKKKKHIFCFIRKTDHYTFTLKYIMLKTVLLVGMQMLSKIKEIPQLCKFPEANPSHAQLRVSSDSVSQYK